MRESRSALLRLVAWFATAVAAGFFFGWLLAPQPSARGVVDSAADARARPPQPSRAAFADEPGLTPTARPSDPQNDSGLSARASPAENNVPMGDNGLPPGVAGYIEVHVVPPAGTKNAGGDAYVLPAGAPGVDDLAQVPHTGASSGEPGLIPVDRPGSYDVGFAWGGDAFLQRNVTVLAGETTAVTFRLPLHGTVRAYLVDPLPTVAGWSVAADLYLESVDDAGARSYPGRGQRSSKGSTARLRPGLNEVGSLLPADRTTARVFLFRSRAKPERKRRRLWSHVAVCEPREVGPGSRVNVRILPAARLRIHVRLDPTSWPIGVERALELRIHHRGGTRPCGAGLYRTPDWTNDDEVVIEEPVPPGQARLDWEGVDIPTGKREGIVLRAGETTDVELPIRFTGDALRTGSPLPVSVDVPESLDADDGIMLAWVGRDAFGCQGVEAWSYEQDDPDEQCVEGSIRLAGAAVVVAGRSWTSGPLNVADVGRLDVRLIRGGRLVVILEIERPEEAGALLLRRKDGLPLHELDEGFELEMTARTGLVLGPLAPGEHVFEVRRGGRRLPDVKAEVRAGRSSPLVISN